MDTYASSAGDSGGFYNIPALGQVVDAFFVMDYELNLQGTSTAASPLTSGEFSSLTTLEQYTSAVPASKVILGVPFFGIDWPTTNGTMAAGAAGGANDIADSQAAANGPEVLGPGHRYGLDELPGRATQWHGVVLRRPPAGCSTCNVAAGRALQRARHVAHPGPSAWKRGKRRPGMIAALGDGISPGAPPGTGPKAHLLLALPALLYEPRPRRSLRQASRAPAAGRPRSPARRRAYCSRPRLPPRRALPRLPPLPRRPRPKHRSSPR